MFNNGGNFECGNRLKKINFQLKVSLSPQEHTTYTADYFVLAGIGLEVCIYTKM